MHLLALFLHVGIFPFCSAFHTVETTVTSSVTWFLTTTPTRKRNKYAPTGSSRKMHVSHDFAITRSKYFPGIDLFSFFDSTGKFLVLFTYKIDFFLHSASIGFHTHFQTHCHTCSSLMLV